jgi:hypothetical protein
MFTEDGDISTLLGRIYDAAGDPTLWAPFLEELAGHTKSDSAAVSPSIRSRIVLSLEFLAGAGGVRSRLSGLLLRLGYLGRSRFAESPRISRRICLHLAIALSISPAEENGILQRLAGARRDRARNVCSPRKQQILCGLSLSLPR